MRPTYEAIIDGERITWQGKRPDLNGRTRVRLNLEVITDGREPNGAKLARMIDDFIQRTGGLTSIDDPVAWQREQRIDRPIEGREP